MLAKRLCVRGAVTVWLLIAGAVVGGLQAEETTTAKLSVKADLVYGMLGPVRDNKYFPGDEIRYLITITGLEENKAGEALFECNAKLQNEAGKTLVEIPPSGIAHQSVFGPGSLFSGGFFLIPADSKYDKVKLLLTVRDLRNDQVQSAEVPIEIVRPESAYLVAPHYTTFINAASPASGHFVVGDHAALHFGVLGLDKLPVDHQHNCRILFVENGKTIGSTKPITIPATSTAGATRHCHFHFSMDREFDGVARLELTNDLDDRKCVVEMPLRVSAPLKLR